MMLAVIQDHLLGFIQSLDRRRRAITWRMLVSTSRSMPCEVPIPPRGDPTHKNEIRKSQCKQAHQCRNWDLVEPAGQERSDDSSSDHDSVSTTVAVAGAEIDLQRKI
eukprot:scaffold1663_cov182-Skeletonema_marinoi.AAC.12